MLRCFSRRSEQTRWLLKHSSSRRQLSSFSAETVKVPVHGNGHITLDIHHPTAPPPSSTGGITPLALIYLPRGLHPSSSDPNNEHHIIRSLRPYLPTTPIIRLNYRSTHHFPGPIHDVLAGYDWITTHCRPSRTAVVGELLGGSLAAALALTECRVGQRGRVVGAAVGSGVLDWTALDDDNDRDGLGLAKSRGRMFAKPEGWFDPFASPLLFFRSAGQAVPRSKTEAVDDMAELARWEREEFFKEQMALSSVSGKADEDGEVSEGKGGAMRKASKRYPAPSLGLKLPDFHISAGKGSVLGGQAKELAGALRKSHLRQIATRDWGAKVLMDEELDDEERMARTVEGERKARLELCEGTGLWDDSREGRRRLVDVAQWLRQVLA